MQTPKRNWIIALVVLVVAAVFTLAWYTGPDKKAARGDADAQAVVEQFGRALKNVPLTGTAEIAREAIEENYAAYVTPELLAQWLANPDTAPGRLTSSPSPDRVAVVSVTEQGRGRIVTGEVILVTSADTPGEPADTVPFVAQVIPTEDGWRIAAYHEEEVQILDELPTSEEDIPGAR